MTDYIATGRVVPERIAAIVKGIAEACVEAGCALVGGETAEHPGPARARRVRRGRRDHRRGRGRPAARPRPGPARRRGDRDGGQRAALQRLLPGPARRCLDDGAAGRSTATSPSSAGPSARSCSTPTRIYAKACLALADRTDTHAMSHVTGGGLAANLERVMPVELAATIDRAHLDPAAGLRPGAPGRRRTPAGPGADPQLRRRHGRADPARRRRHGRSRCSPRTASGPGWPARCRPTPSGGGRVELVGQHPGW